MKRVELTQLQNGYQGKTRSLVGDAKFESMVRRESRKNILKENSTLEEEQEDEAAREDEIFLLQSLEDEAANSKVFFLQTCSLDDLLVSGEADHPDKVERGHRGIGSGGENGRGGRRQLDPHGDERPKAGARTCQHGGSSHCRGVTLLIELFDHFVRW